jgi:arsenate reductase (thioredoxin)
VEKLRVLFLCTGNRARSQMAQGFLRHFAGDRFLVYSAGTEPRGLSPTTVAVMREIGIDVSEHRSKSIGEFVDQEFDYVITVWDTARAVCPTFDRAARQLLHWNISDPAALERSGMDSINAFRAAREQVQSKTEDFIKRGTAAD